MSSGADTTQPVEPHTVDWEAIFNELGGGPADPQSASQLRGIVFVTVDGVGSQAAAAEFIHGAHDAGALDRVDEGFVVDGYADSADTESPEEDDEGDAERTTTTRSETRPKRDHDRLDALEQRVEA